MATPAPTSSAREIRRLAAFTFAILLSSAVRAQTNTNFDTAASLSIGHPALSHIGPGSSAFFFLFQAVPGRSYCVETSHDHGQSGYTQAIPHAVVTVINTNQFTVLSSSNSAPQEPFQKNLGRACFIEPVGGTPHDNYVELFPAESSLTAALPVELRVVETTLFCPWFFVAGDYNAFTLLRNTSATDLPLVVVTWRGLNGTIAGTTNVSVPANGGLILNARDFVNPALFSNGTIEVAHYGSPEQLQGSTTTLSGTTGLGFDAQFTQRRAW